MADAIENENTNNAGSDDAEKKQQHIKDRLKEMGVADDSVRPQKSRLARFANFIIVAVVAVLVVAYVYEYQHSTADNDDAVADQTSTLVQKEAVQNTVPTIATSNQQHWQQPQQQPGQWPQYQPELQTDNQLTQPQAYNDRYAQQRYWSQAYQYQPPAAAYWPPYGGYYGYRQPAYGGYYPQQNQNETAKNIQQQAPVYRQPVPYAGQPFYNGWYR